MREQLISYVELLFAGSVGLDDMKQEILQNTLERYDDLLAQGKTPEAAYRLAISGIGDISELLGTQENAEPTPIEPTPLPAKKSPVSPVKRILKGLAIFLYIISPIPLFVLDWIGMSELGLCGTIVICAVATAILVIIGATDSAKEDKRSTEKVEKSENPLYKAIGALITTVGIIAYFLVSFTTAAWYITWVIFPLIGAVKGLLKAIFDLTGVQK